MENFPSDPQVFKYSLAMNRDFTLEQLRENYKLHALLESEAAKNPMDQFDVWFKEALAAKLPEPNAMCLSTCGKDMQPHSRIVLLKGVDNGFIFYSNYASNKGIALQENPKAALNFLWLGLERQVRISGEVKKISKEKSVAYFKTRPIDSQLGALASNQSTVIDSREVLENKLAELKQQYSEDNHPEMPDHWGGYVLVPKEIEFWQGRHSRLHDRLRYTLNTDESWTMERLSP